MTRTGDCVRNTSETQIEVSINLDGTGKSEVNTGIGFFDHMLISFAKHGLFDLTVKVTRRFICGLSPYNRRYRHCPWYSH